MPDIIIMHPAGENQDKFFLCGMILLPILSLWAYIFDAFYYYHTLHLPNPPSYEGLLSTILIVFSYLQYCAPIKSRRFLFAYHVSLWILVEIGHIGYILSFLYAGKVFSVVVYVGWMICDTLFTSGLLYCRIYRRLDYHIEVDNTHIFHFISRLEVILAIFIPIFLSRDYTTTTRDNIAFFLLFDFFSEKYDRFSGVWIKSCLYLFVALVTVSVASEWLYFSFKEHTFEYITDVSELVAAYFCDTLIIMQFFTFHFRPQHLNGLVQEVKVIVANDRPIITA